jgi:hypothetical protein
MGRTKRVSDEPRRLPAHIKRSRPLELHEVPVDVLVGRPFRAPSLPVADEFWPYGRGPVVGPCTVFVEIDGQLVREA